MNKNNLIIFLLTLFCSTFVTWGSPVSKGKKFTLVIDAGHGGHDPGAEGLFAKEKNINLNIALEFGRLVERNCPDVKVIYTRNTDVFVPLDERANIANKAKANLFISIHTNALPKGKIAHGTETYTLGMARAAENLEVAKRENSVILEEDNYKERYAGFNPNSSESYIIFEFLQDQYMEKSIKLAKIVQRQVHATAGREDKGVHQAGFLVLRKTSMPSVLIELGYISTPEEENFLVSQQGISNMSKSIFQAFLKYKNNDVATSDNNIEVKPIDIPSNINNSFDELQQIKKDSDTNTRSLNTNISLNISSDVKIAKDSINIQKSTNIDMATASRPDKINNEKKEILQKQKEDSIDCLKPVFKIQLFTTKEQLPKGSSLFNGLENISYYREKELYKYTYGESNNYKEIERLKKNISLKFKGAFIVAFKEKEKIDLSQAIREIKDK